MNRARAIFRESRLCWLPLCQCFEHPTNCSPALRIRGRRKGSPLWFGRDRRRSRASCPERRCWLCWWACRIPATWGRLSGRRKRSERLGRRRALPDGIGTADPFGPKALRASAGSALRLPIVHGISPAILLAQLRMIRSENLCRCCCSARGENSQNDNFGCCFPSIAPVGHRLENSFGYPDRQRRFRLARGPGARGRRARLHSASGGNRSCRD